MPAFFFCGLEQTGVVAFSVDVTIHTNEPTSGLLFDCCLVESQLA